MQTKKNALDQSFITFSTFIEHQKQLTELKATFYAKKSSIAEARKILDSYIKPSQKLSDDISEMREE